MNVALQANLIHELFDAAVELPVDRREPFLLASGVGADLRAAVFSLLDAHDRATAFLADPSVSPEQIAARFGLQPGSRLDRYTILQPLGEGGHGTVYLAQQDPPIARRVALKVIKAGMDTGQVVARFNRERESLARMDHPNVARVFDAGVTPGGRPFFAMEWVDGDPITDYCRRQRLPLRGRLELFAVVCAAVQHAHDRGILHRDLKPANVLVSGAGGTVTPKVIDFGIAKAMSTDDAGVSVTTLTVGPQFLGTPQYMSPEQADSAAVVDARTDVYGLGGLLYELLTGSPPIDRSAFDGGDPLAVRRVLRETTPPLPSARLDALGQSLRPASPEEADNAVRWAQRVRGELDWIVARAIHKDRDRRYGSAAALADDVKRFLAGDPVAAGGGGVRYRFSKWAAQPLARVTASSVAALVVLSVGWWWWSHRQLEQRPPTVATAVPPAVAPAVPPAVVAPVLTVMRLPATQAMRPIFIAIVPTTVPTTAPSVVVAPTTAPVARVSHTVRVSYAHGDTQLATLGEAVQFYSNREMSFPTLPAEMCGLTYTRRPFGRNIGATLDVPADTATYLILADGSGAAPARDAAWASGWVRIGAGKLQGAGEEWSYVFFRRPAGQAVHVTIPGSTMNQVTVVAADLSVATTDPAAPVVANKPPVRIISAWWGDGRKWVDVTRRVTDLVAAGSTVWADPDTLGADPATGWKKHLEVTFEIGGRRRTSTAYEGRAIDLSGKGP
jgi:hypothetical protein